MGDPSHSLKDEAKHNLTIFSKIYVKSTAHFRKKEKKIMGGPSQRLEVEENHVKEEDRTMHDLDSDVISAIFSKLPVKSIARFRTLSMNWCSYLTNNPYFLKLNSTNQQRQFVFFDGDKAFNTKLYLLENLTWIWKVTKIRLSHKVQRNPLLGGIYATNSCNGLLCSFQTARVIIIQNPITGKSVTLPPIPVDNTVAEFSSRILFGFDEKAETYKVMLFWNTSFVYIITCGDSSWREMDLPMEIQNGYFNLEGSLFLNQEFYCILTDTRDDDHVNIFILAMDISSEKFRIISFPRLQTEKYEFYYWLFNLGEKLAFVVSSWVEDKRERFNFKIQCWILVDAIKATWIQQSQMGNDIVLLSSTSDGTAKILGSVEKENLVVTVHRLGRHELFLYNPTSGKQNSYVISGDSAKLEMGIPFQPSLISPNF